ncbi:OmpA family protein [Maridesulfovibrio sp. FT414]|uniref:OmpA family protein n=1 Tax=Maridesulfovibrio sp. FT414 TaxID=2979469 RepID=UPI003D803216
MKQTILTLILILLWAPAVHSQQDGFASSSEEILNMLTDDGGRVYLKIEFDVNSAKISKKALPVADALGTALTTGDAAAMDVKLIGHTDSAGNSEYNRKLSLERAASVKQYMVTKFNISPDRIQVEGMGEDKPIAPNNTIQGRALNRRVEIVNISKKPVSKSVVPAAGSLFQ